MANANLTLQPETRPSLYGGPKIKSEVDELSALGGMTRLVSRRSSSSPSVSASSPISQHSSPPSNVPPDSQIFLSQPEPSTTPNSWQNYTHIQNFNVNINMGEYYPNSLPVTPDPSQNQGDMYLYQMPQHIQHQQQQPHVVGMNMNAQQSYFAGGYGPGYGNGQYMPMSGQMTPASELTTPGPHDLQESWQNFVAQYK